MNTTTTVALISGLVGVAGALIGAGLTLVVGLRAERRQRKHDHDDALLAFWTAAASFGALWSALAELLPAESNWLKKMQKGLQLNPYAQQLVERQFSVSDAVFHAMGRVRAVGTASELRVVSAVETAIGDWKVGHSMPMDFAAALRDLRILIESLGPSHGDVDAAALN
ncbi:MAG TPA: hypothetical protein VGH52_04145 [Gaiellaceae bacterium]